MKVHEVMRPFMIVDRSLLVIQAPFTWTIDGDRMTQDEASQKRPISKIVARRLMI